MKHFLFIVALALVMGTQGFAQEKYSLTLEDAQAYALEHNRQLKNASIDILTAEAQRWQTIATMLPQVNASLDYANMMGYSMQLSGFSISMPPYGTLGITTSISLSAAQIINISLGEISSKMAEITRQQTEQEVVSQVKSIYYSTLIMEETVDLLKKNLNNLEKVLEHTEQMVKVGTSEQSEADQIAVQVASMKASVNSSERSLEMLYNSLRYQLGLDVNTEIDLTQTLDDLMSVEKAMLLVTEEFVLDNNYDYQLLQQNLDLAKKQVDLKKSDYAPSVSAYYQYSEKKYFSDEETMNMTPPNMIGVTLSIPIFSSAGRYKAVQEAKLGYQKQMNTMADTKESLLIEHRQLCFNLRSAFDSYEAQDKNMEVAQRLFDNTTRKYETGVASSLDVTDSGTNLITAQSNYVQSILDLVSAQIALEQLLNTDNK